MRFRHRAGASPSPEVSLQRPPCPPRLNLDGRPGRELRAGGQVHPATCHRAQLRALPSHAALQLPIDRGRALEPSLQRRILSTKSRHPAWIHDPSRVDIDPCGLHGSSCLPPHPVDGSSTLRLASLSAAAQ
ncbi:hypothetical protein VFPBJ_00788 [Purpureocillium lilacinum]|uniref:Uncharacterized protein n=1 Tax=Purpureocillium lilacinum TaxID=33203 RepID=A0A179HAP1_PURLI|nr:hypothetical protein VFPBJ_00788 [Purpureocillium lilacinum]